MSELTGNDLTAPIKLWPEDRTLLYMMTEKQVGQIIKPLCLMAEGIAYTPPKDPRLANAFAMLAQRHIQKTVNEWNRHCERGKKAADARWKNDAKAMHRTSIAQASPKQCLSSATMDYGPGTLDNGLIKSTDISTVPFAPGTEKTERNGTVSLEVESQVRELVRDFGSALKEHYDQAFYSGAYNATTICLYLTGDYGSIRRWGQLAREKGESAVIEEAHKFWSEMGVGETVDNAGAALNARLAKLPNLKPTAKRGEA